MSNLDDRLNRSLGGAYRATFGTAPAILPSPARGRGVVLAASVGAVGVVAAVAVPLVLAHTLSGTTATPAAAHPAVLQTGSPSPARNQACGPDDVKLTAYLNQPSFKESVITQTDRHLPAAAFVGFGILTGTNTTPCRVYNDTASVGFIAPSGEYLGFNGGSCFPGGIKQENRTGPAPTVDPLEAAPCPAATAPRLTGTSPPDILGAVPATPTSNRTAPTRSAPQSDYGVLLGSAGTIDVPADGLGSDAYGKQLNDLHQGNGTVPEPVYHQVPDDYVNDPYLIPKNKVETGTWKMRVTFGNLTVDTPFEVTAG